MRKPSHSLSSPAGEYFFDLEVDGCRLYGMGHEPLLKPPQAIIVSSHGLNGERVDTHRMLVKAARSWAKLGFLCLRFDHRGCGLSDGAFWKSLPDTRMRDVKAVVAMIRHQYPDLPLILHGFSDSCHVMSAVAIDLNPLGVILWSPILFAAVSSGEPGPLPVWQRHPDDPRAFVRPFLGHWLSYQYLRDTASWQAPGIEQVPLLVVRGANDLDIQPSLRALEAANAAFDLVTIADTGHLYASPCAEQEVIERTGEWMVERLRSYTAAAC